MGPEPPPWTLTIPNDLNLLGLARSFVETVCLSAGLDEETTASIVLAADEATNNVIRHAHQCDPAAQLTIQCFVWPDRIEVHLHDDGMPFDITKVPEFDPSEMRVGGRGIYLMRAIMDELISQPRGERGNVLRMVKRCTPGSTPADGK